MFVIIKKIQALFLRSKSDVAKHNGAASKMSDYMHHARDEDSKSGADITLCTYRGSCWGICTESCYLYHETDAYSGIKPINRRHISDFGF